jgi:hypothetical protein
MTRSRAACGTLCRSRLAAQSTLGWRGLPSRLWAGWCDLECGESVHVGDRVRFGHAEPAVLGATVLASLAKGRPFASWFASEIYPLPQEMRESDTFRHAMRTITAVWGLYFLARAIVRLTALLTLSTDRFALVIALTDAPFLIAILAWSVYHTVGAFRNNARWAPMIAAAEASRGRSKSLPG